MDFFQVKVIEGNNNGFIYYGVGIFLIDGFLINYGGVIFGYNELEVLLWWLVDLNINGYIWYRGGDFGGGDYFQIFIIVEVIVDIF